MWAARTDLHLGQKLVEFLVLNSQQVPDFLRQHAPKDYVPGRGPAGGAAAAEAQQAAQPRFDLRDGGRQQGGGLVFKNQLQGTPAERAAWCSRTSCRRPPRRRVPCSLQAALLARSEPRPRPACAGLALPALEVPEAAERRGGRPAQLVADIPFAKVTMKQREHTTFRSNNVRFLQEQNKEATRALDAMEEERDEAVQAVFKWEQQREKVQREYAALQQQMAATEEKCNAAAAEVHKRDEQIRVLTEQNRSLLEMLEHEEKESKEKQQHVDELTHESHRLQKISDQYDKVKDTGNQQLTGAYTEIAKYEEEMRNASMETEQLREAERNFQAQAKIDVETLENKLRESKDKNVQKLQQIQHNEVHEHRLQEGIQRLKETLEELKAQQKGVKMQLDMESDSAEKWSHSKAEVEHRKVSLQKNVEALREALKAAEEQNAAMQEESKQGADNFRQLGDKVYALMDQLRQHQMDLKKQEQNGIEKQKKITQLDKRSAELQQTLQLEVDAKLAAESEARGAAQMQALLLKKNKMLEEAHQLALRAQEKVEKRLSELTEKAHALQTQNDYLGTRIDGNEEDKGALRYELRRAEDEMRQASTYNQQLTQQQQEANDRQSIAETERAALKAELDYIKREDMLDESGRTKPILIESESKLIERLQINEFLFSAQQARNPVPMLVEKVSHVLEMLHTSQAQADLYLQDLQRSNSMLTALRQKNMTLYEKVQLCETWKMRALLKIASNEFEVRQNVKGVKRDAEPNHKLYLDGLQYTNKELEELKK
ncbi:unnamed protein product, partial [Prorocentrum cordatum]